ncbi:MAG: glycerate kinase [Anaerolineales bacterium]
MFAASQFDSYALRAHARGDSVQRILAAAFHAARADEAARRYLKSRALPNAQRIFAFGLGKASPAMMTALVESIRPADMLLIAKHAAPYPQGAQLVLGNHPIPGEGSLQAGRAAQKFLSQLTEQDLLVCLISGGGSALMTAPLIPLSALQALTARLLASGANIEQINTVRRHVDSLKGGGVAQAAHGARILSLILSDVTSDALESIASGPTAPDPTTIEDAQRIAAGESLRWRETLKPNDPIFARVENVIIASNRIALRAAKTAAEQEGFYAKVIEEGVQGEAREVGKRLAQTLKQAERELPRPFCLLAGGETTVTLRGGGTGGRNQETALSAVNELRGAKDVLFISIATDGEDGATDAAGAVVSGESAARAEALGMHAEDFLRRNDSYRFFSPLKDLLQPGSSGTNVNDLMLLFGL